MFLALGVSFHSLCFAASFLPPRCRSVIVQVTILRQSTVAVLPGILSILCQHIALSLRVHHSDKVYGNVLRGDAALEAMQHSKSRVRASGRLGMRMEAPDAGKR